MRLRFSGGTTCVNPSAALVVIMLEAGLSYLNLGVKPPTPSWGNILYDGYTSLRQQPVLVAAAGVPLVLSTIGFTFLGEGLRDAAHCALAPGYSHHETLYFL